MSRPKKYPIITSAEYFAKQDKNESYKGYIVYPDGKVNFALSEVVVTSTPLHLRIDKYSNISAERFSHFHLATEFRYHESSTPYVCDNLRVDSKNLILQVEYNLQTSQVKYDVKFSLLNSIISYYQVEEYARIQKAENLNSMMTHSPSMIQIDVANPRTYYQKEFAKIKAKIESGNIKKTDFPQNVASAARREIETYFACFDPEDPNYKHFWNVKYSIGEATGLEAYIPVWGNVRNSVNSFQRGAAGDGIQYYSYGVGYFCFALADVLSIGMVTEAMMLSKGSTSMLSTVPSGAYNPAYFPTIRGGYGVFGRNGLNIRNYRIDMLYQYRKGGGSIFSIKGGINEELPNLFRLDYNLHGKNPMPFWHYHYRYTHNSVTYGSTKPIPLFKK